MSVIKREGKTGVRYVAVIDGPRDPVTGKRNQIKRTFKTKKEADSWEREQLTAVERGTFVAPVNETVGAYLSRWLDTYAKHNVRATTYRSYEQLIRRHITPALGNVRLQKLTPVQLQAFYSDKLTSGRADGKDGGLSPRTVRYLHTIIREALQQAMKWGLVVRNVADATEPPRGVRPAVVTWDADQARAFLAAASGDGYGAVWVVAMTTGLRRGELLALRWADVDLTRGTLYVRRSLVEIGSKLVYQEPKTASGRRSVQLPQSTVAALKEHRARQNEVRLGHGDVWHDNDLIFATALGGPIAPRNLIRRFKELTDLANEPLLAGDTRRLPTIRFHDLRHTHATLLLKEGTHAKIVSERLGHANIGITLDTYSHVLPDMQAEAAKNIDRALFGT